MRADEIKRLILEEANLKRFIEPKAMNIRALGEKTLAKLYGRGLVNKPQDLYTLDNDYLINRRIVTPVQLDKIYYAILKTPSVRLQNVLYALNIPNVGLDHAETIASHCKTLRGFMHDSEEIYYIDDLPQKVKDSVAEWLGKLSNHELMAFLISRRVGLLPYEDPCKGKPFDGQRWYFSIFDGRTLSLRKKILSLGGKVSDTLTKRDMYAVFVKPPTLKQIEGCQDYGVTMLTLSEAQDKVERRKQHEDKKVTDPFIKHLRGI